MRVDADGNTPAQAAAMAKSPELLLAFEDAVGAPVNHWGAEDVLGVLEAGKGRPWTTMLMLTHHRPDLDDVVVAAKDFRENCERLRRSLEEKGGA